MVTSPIPNPSLADITQRFTERSLGALAFPNGTCMIPTGIMPWQHFDSPFFVHLRDLYHLIFGWDVKNPLVDPADVVAIIAFGRAVQYPGVDRVQGTRRRFWLFGPEVPCVDETPIQPVDAEFLLITASDCERNASIASIWFPMDCQILMSGGIQVTSCSLAVAREVLRNPKGSVASAIRDGVPICADDRFKELLSQSGIKPSGARHIVWVETDRNLQGTIY